MRTMVADLEEAEIFLRGIVSLESKSSSYKWWGEIKHRYPDYEWDGEKITKRDNKIKGDKCLELQ